MTIRLNVSRTSAKKRTALYIDLSQYEEVAEVAEKEGCSFNRAAEALLGLGLDTHNGDGLEKREKKPLKIA